MKNYVNRAQRLPLWHLSKNLRSRPATASARFAAVVRVSLFITVLQTQAAIAAPDPIAVSASQGLAPHVQQYFKQH